LHGPETTSSAADAWRPVNDRQNLPPRARVVLFGMRCAFTEPVLNARASAPTVDLRAVVLPEGADTLPEGAADPVLETIRANQIRLVGLNNPPGMAAPEIRASFEAIAPDVVMVACFPWRLPGWLLALPARACLNVHPSLLPDGRGPEPVFWAFRWGLTETGVTLHVMDGGLDTGPIIAQRRVVIPEDATVTTLEHELARIGAGLLIDTLPSVLDGTVIASPQEGQPARYARFPRPEDLLVDTSWSARAAARFIRAMTPAHGPLPVLVRATGQRLNVSEVLGITDDAAMTEPLQFQGSDALIRFTPGALLCRPAASQQPLRLHRPGT
jgi:methionyl-tRNA formyltransferase